MLQRLLILLAFTILMLIIYRLLLRRARGRFLDDPNQFMAALAEEAIRYAATRNVTLDYSPDSVAKVEEMLEELHKSFAAGQLSDIDLQLHAHQFGAYIGEVLRRQYGGHWAEDHHAAGPKTYPIHWQKKNSPDPNASFTVGWCGKRIVNGPEDNVWHKYQVVTSEDFLSDLPKPPD
jgi:hypothetical protein